MQALLERELLLERRQASVEEESLWDKLSLAQKFAANAIISSYKRDIVLTSSLGP